MAESKQVMTQTGQYSNPLKATIKGIMDLYKKDGPELTIPDGRLDGKKILITGSSSGLGLATAKALAAKGAYVIMAVRSGIPERGEEVKAASGNQNIEMLHVDLSDFESIGRFLDNLNQTGHKIDIYISNAAMVPSQSRKTAQGLEEMFMVNYLSAFYLTNLLLDRSIIRQEGRIIFVSSESHRDPKSFNWEKFGAYEDYGMKDTVARYGYYKLMLTTYANELSRRISQPVRVLCPGPVNSNIAREAPKWSTPLLKLVFSLFFKSPEKASLPVQYFSLEAESAPIDYMFLMRKKEMDPKALDPENGQHLWNLSQSLIDKSIS